MSKSIQILIRPFQNGRTGPVDSILFHFHSRSGFIYILWHDETRMVILMDNNVILSFMALVDSANAETTKHNAVRMINLIQEISKTAEIEVAKSSK